MLHLEDVLQLKDDEEVHLIVRRHGYTLWPSLLLAFVLIVVPFFLMFPLFSLGVPGIVLFCLATVLGILTAIRAFLLWDADVFIVTNMRVVDVDQRGVFDRFVAEALLDNVQDISWSRKGMFDTLIGVGNLTVQTAGAVSTIEASRIKRPERVQETINDLRNRTVPKKTSSSAERTALFKGITKMLEHYSVEELRHIETVLKVRERSVAADTFFAGDEAASDVS